ncbi:MAG: DNA polymerase I [Sedimentisphaeraceae bacterium JB056]
MKKSLYIIDGHALIYSGYYAPMRANLTSPAGEPTKSTFIFTNTILGLINRKKPDMLVVAMDSKGKTFRSDIYPDYKAHRPPMPEDMPVQINRIEQILTAMHIPILRIDGFEADDIIGTLAEKGKKMDMDVYICSKDKDMLQLLDEGVYLYDMKKDEVKDVQWLKDEKGITPDQFIDALALQGDTADNIPGLPDVGPKTSEQWIAKYGSIENLYEHSDEIKGKRGDSLRNNKDQLEVSRKLVVINCDSPVEIEPDLFTLKEPDKDQLAELFGQLGFNKLAAQLGITQEDMHEDGDQASLFDGSKSKKSGSKTESAEPTAQTKKNIQNTDHKYELINTKEKLDTFLEELRKQEIFAIDTETTSINSMEADLVGISISYKAASGYYLPVKAPLGDKKLNISDLKEPLGEILSNPDIKKIGQNLKYDMPVLANAGMPLEGAEFDTMIASYVLDASRKSNSMDNMSLDYLGYECVPISELIGTGKKQRTFDTVQTDVACEYAAEDADITWQLYEYLKPRLENQPQLQKLFTEIEMPLMLVLTKMEMSGVSIDAALLRNMSHEIAERIDSLTDTIHEKCGNVFNIDSPKQLSEILFDRLSLPQIKKRSTDADVLEKLSDFHPVIEDILEYRQLSKLKNTYLDKLPAMVNRKTGRLHASFNQTVTATGRLSSSNPNLQNIPVRSEIGRKIRSAFVAEDTDGVILSADYSQIELRLLAHLSGDKSLLGAFADNMDIHRFVASQVFDVEPQEVTDDMRAKAKAVNFGVIYGQGPYALSQSLGIPQKEAKAFIESYFQRYSTIKQFMEEVIEKTKKDGYASTILGRRRAIDGLNARNANIRSSAERMAFNTAIQGSAADLIKLAMINIQHKIDAEGLPVRMILQIHDELVFELPESGVDEYTMWIKGEMEHAIDLSVKLKVDTGYGKTWFAGH